MHRKVKLDKGGQTLVAIVSVQSDLNTRGTIGVLTGISTCPRKPPGDDARFYGIDRGIR